MCKKAPLRGEVPTRKASRSILSELLPILSVVCEPIMVGEEGKAFRLASRALGHGEEYDLVAELLGIPQEEENEV